MKDKAKISIIIPVYNTEKYLKECIESAMHQTLTDIEIICVNDGSTDTSLEILKSFAEKDNRLKIVTQQNKGQSAARNTGLKIATGEYIAFLDSDDFFENIFAEQMYQKAQSQDADITMCSMNIVKNDKKETTHPYLSLDIIPKELDNIVFNITNIKKILFNICVTPWNKIYKTDFLRKNDIKFLEKINFEDNLFFIESFVKAKKINIIRENLVNYRYFSDTSYSTQNGKHDLKKLDFFRIIKKEKKILQENNLYSELKEDFEKHKEKTLLYWKEKTKNPLAKVLYNTKLYTTYPLLPIKKLTQKAKQKQIAQKIKELTSKKKIVFRGANSYLESVLKLGKLENNPNILGIIDQNPQKTGKSIAGYQIHTYDFLQKYSADELVISETSIPNFTTIVENEIKNQNIYIKINTDIFEV